MPFRPTTFVGRPLTDLLDAVAVMESGLVRSSDVRLFDGQTTWPTVAGDARLPDDMSQVDLPGIILDEYLGGGGQGCVFAGRMAATGKLVAVKLLSQGRAVREALLAGRVRHPNVLRVLRAQPAGKYWIVLMELIRGTELGRTLPTDLRSCLRHLADAIRAVAEARLVHRDVKPANVLLRTPDANPVLVDFGLAIDLGSRDEEEMDVSGTPLFLPPEAWRHEKPTSAWDAYALGITAAIISGVKLPTVDGVGSLRPVKLDRRFDQAIEHGLGQIADRAVAEWSSELIQDDPQRRLAALRNAADQLAA